MAQKRTIDIDINTNADQAAKEFDDLGKATNRAAQSVDNLDATFEEVYGDLQPLTTRLGEAEDRLYELALAGDTTSKEYQELLTKVGEYRKVQIETDLAVDGAATTMTQKLGSALNGVTSGFAVTQGALALFGSENEALEKSLLKVQAALAIQQGVDGLRTAYKELAIGTKLASVAQGAFAFVTGGASTALKVFRLALISTGIGAIVVAIGLLIANFDKVTKVIKNAINVALKPIKAAIDAIVDSYYAVTDALGFTSEAERQREKQAKINAANAKKRAEEERKRIQETIQLNKDLGAEKRRQFIAEKKRIETIKRLKQEEFDLEIALLESQGRNTIQLRKKEQKNCLMRQKRMKKYKDKLDLGI